MSRVSVLGAGTWGIALARVLNKNGHDVTIWSALKDEIDMLNTNHEHKMLPGVKIDESIKYTCDDEEAVKDMDLVVMAVASKYTRSTANRFAKIVKKGQLIVDVAKGIEEDSLKTLSQIIEEEIPDANVCVLSGPSHAEEVIRDIPTTIVAGAHRKKDAEFIQTLFMNENFRVYTSPDMLGMELGAALKNVVALAAGAADGLGYGDNTKAALITRGIAEIKRLAVAMGCNPETINGLTGMGDLIVTCASMHSRNRRAGILIGQGMSCEDAMKEVKMVVEGVYSAKAALQLSKKYNVNLPIIEQVNLVLFEGKNPADAVKELMLRDKKIEISDSMWDKE
ncbi:MAG: NAD(P)H-dependent glycerol-3-phosphate dehydrogenase [Lachnospiraceae bacterium]|nr:NAD(P)H-dependent glycerol-3-phosphate dehydrogenase [Lachnospiraceae bacterium]